MLGLERRERQRAVARDHRRDAVLEGGPGEAVPGELCIVVGMRVDEAGGHDLACRVHDLARLAEGLAGRSADRGDAAILDREVARKARPTRAVADPAVLDDEVQHAGRLLAPDSLEGAAYDAWAMIA